MARKKIIGIIEDWEYNGTMNLNLWMNYLWTGIICLGTLTTLWYFASKSKRAKDYLWPIVISMVAIICELLTSRYDHSPSHRVVSIIANVLGFSLSPIIPFFLAKLFVTNGKPFPIWSFIPPALNCIASVLSAFVPCIFTVTAEYGYQRGPGFGIYVACYLFGLIFLFWWMMTLVRDKYRPFLKPLFLLFFFVVTGTFIQVIDQTTHTTWLCITIALTLHKAFYSEIDNMLDFLTGVYNRKMYEMKIKEYQDNKTKITVTMFDIDDFKRLNDTYGHIYGDKVLTIVGFQLLDSFTGVGDVFRVGGDEFCVLSTKEVDYSWVRANLFQAELKRQERKVTLLPTVSYGIAEYDPAGKQTLREAIKKADDSLYERKRGKTSL